MTFCTQIVTVAAVLIALALWVPLQAKTLQDDSLRARTPTRSTTSPWSGRPFDVACRLRDEGLTGTYG